MKKLLLLTTILALSACSSQDGAQSEQAADNNAIETSAVSNDVARWEAQAANITIQRDEWGIPHIYGKTDADAVFGVMYAQAEDDFNRVEVNYMNAMGLLAQAEGESQIFKDLRMRLFIQEDEMKRLYAEAPEWLQELMIAYADGLNYYLYKNPQVQAKVIKHFEPWMALSFSEGSIGGDIERISINELENFYGGTTKMAEAPRDLDMEPRGSNGMAIAPEKTVNGKALLYINPHTTYYFREEAHMVSEQGLDAYGALTWGQFFIYQGFNENNGWMHTSTKSDVIDEFVETIIEKDGKLFYKYGDEEREVTVSIETIDYKTDSGMASRDFTVYHTHHGPIVREKDGSWISVQLMNVPLTALNQSYTRTKTSSYEEFYEMMRLKSNSSNNTVYADKDGNIAYFHGNFHPIRNAEAYDYNNPVDGSNPDTDWKGLHPVEDAINLFNPGSGWLYNSNNWPFSAAGPDHSPKKEDYPSYMSVNFENPRGEHALALYPTINDFTVEKLIEVGYDTHLPSFERFVPVLKAAFDAAPDESLKDAVDMLVAWDKRSSMESIETTLANHFGNELWKNLPPRGSVDPYDQYAFIETQVDGDKYLVALKDALARMEADFGSWKVAWGEINRFQRNTGDMVQKFDDDKPSHPSKLVTARWGGLASVGSRQYPGTKKWYGTSGNSFIASIEFGDKVRAKALMAGGLNSDPASPHFDDQGAMYGLGTFRDVHYYKEDVDANTKRTYHPGE